MHFNRIIIATAITTIVITSLRPLSAQPSYTRSATQLEDILPSSPEASSRVRYADVPSAGGRLTPGGALHYVTDHLGSVRAVVDGSAEDAAATPPTNILAVGDYSPYGERSQSAAASLLTLAQAPAGTTLRHRFTAQEDQGPDFQTGYTDFGARQYNVNLRRWMVPDPMGEAYYDISPYAYCAGDPVNLVDETGMNWYSFTNSQGKQDYRYVEGQLSDDEIKKGKYKDMGYAFRSGEKYYSLFGQVIDYPNNGSKEPSIGQLYEVVDNLLIAQGKYKISISPWQTEDVPAPSIDYTIPGVDPGTYQFVYAGQSFSSERDGTFYNAIDPKGRLVYGKRIIGDNYVTISRFPSSGYTTRHGIGQSNSLKGWSGYFIVASPRDGKNFDSMQVWFKDKASANRFLQSFNNIFDCRY